MQREPEEKDRDHIDHGERCVQKVPDQDQGAGDLKKTLRETQAVLCYTL